jgi:hypothetical protein
MRKYSLVVSLVLFSVLSFAQVPEDALRVSWTTPSGTARNQAIGGVMTSLGGDMSANFINPAGIGLYRTSEFVLSPGFNFFNNGSTFRGTKNAQTGNGFVLGTSGFVFGINDPYRANRSSAFSIAVNRSASFNNHINYKGLNNFSSFSEAYASEIAGSGLTLDNALNSNTISFPARMAIYTFLADTLTTLQGGTEVVATPLRYAYEKDTAFSLNQQNDISTKGGITEIAFSFAGNRNDKFYWGASIGLPILNYERTSVLTETDAGSNAKNYFKSATLTERYTSKGIGLNLKLGLIFKPIENIRVGAAIHSPTIFGVKDTYDATLTTDLENYNAASTVNVSTLNNGVIPQYNYDQNTPWRFLGSVSYIFKEAADTRKQRGFVSADVEYVTYGSNKFSNSDPGVTEDQAYFNSINSAIKRIYKGALNAKIGGELKFNTIMARLGFAYYGNPYRDQPFKGNRMYISGGLGYRNKGYFVDLAYVHRITKDVNFPYRLDDKANTYADVRGTGGNVVATVGLKF